MIWQKIIKNSSQMQNLGQIGLRNCVCVWGCVCVCVGCVGVGAYVYAIKRGHIHEFQP